MNWDAISAVGEGVGAIAVVISLIYVAQQIRSQTRQAKLSALHEMAREQRDATAIFATEDISTIFVRANKDFSSLSESESVQLIVLVTNLFRAWENAFLESRDGSLDDTFWLALSRDYTQTMGASSIRHIWSLRKQNYDSEFQEYVDGIEPDDYITR